MADMIKSIVNKPIKAMMLAEDCLLMEFAGCKVHLYEWPELTLDSTLYAYEDEAYSDKLQTLVSREVTKCVFSEGEALTLYFGSDMLALQLEEDEELVYIRDDNGGWEAF
jgi:hypothetical protein